MKHTPFSSVLAIMAILLFWVLPVAAVSEAIVKEWDEALKEYGITRVPRNSVPAGIKNSTRSWQPSLSEVVAIVKSGQKSSSETLEETSSILLYSSTRTYECSKLVGGLGNGWFRAYVDANVGRRHGKQIFESKSNSRWAHTGLTLGTSISKVSLNDKISSDKRKLSMRSSWVVSVWIPTPWGEFYFHSESVSQKCHKSP